MGIPRVRAYAGPAILSYGFRPLFLFGSLYAASSILFWLPLYRGILETSSVFVPVDWHVHEMLFGFLPAIVTGFLLTAIPNWTGRLPVQGLPVLALVLVWLAGRAAVFFSAFLGWEAAAAVDCAFLSLVVATVATEIIAGRNWRNLKVLGPICLLLCANVLFHIQAQQAAGTDLARRFGISAVAMLIMIIGGRIVPSFTRNWLARQAPGRLPAPFGRFDASVIAVSGLALAGWTVAPGEPGVGAALAAASVLQLVRLSRWVGDRAWREPLLIVLHAGYAFLPVGLLLCGLSALWPDRVAAAAGFHAFGVGAIGTMTLAVMVRATLGHTGRPLEAGLRGSLIFLAVVAAALLRMAATVSTNGMLLVELSGLAWSAAFLGYALGFGHALLTRRR